MSDGVPYRANRNGAPKENRRKSEKRREKYDSSVDLAHLRAKFA